MSAIDQKFAELRAQGKKAFIPFVTAGDPSLQVTAEALKVLSDYGCALAEVGIPYSDPIADGPVIQASYTRALEAGIKLKDIFAAVAEVSPKLAMPLVSMVSYSIIQRVGAERYVADAQRAVVWNMGEIAASRHPDAPALFRKVILASAAIPGAFPPVSIEVEANGKTYEEMHVDGGTTMEVFASPVNLPMRAFDRLYARPPLRRIYVVKNGRLDPEYAPVKPQTIPIGARAITTLLLNQSNDDIYRIYRTGLDAGADFNLMAIPKSFQAERREVFDPIYQGALFDAGHAMGRTRAWQKEPPSQRAMRLHGR